jgi:hypothetical protein
MQLGFMLFCYFLSVWGSRAKDHHSAKEWPKHEQFLTRQKNIQNEPLVHPKKTFLTLLYMKLV